MALFGCSDIDNYKEPDSRIEGRLIDATTGELVPSQGLNGARIQLFEVYNGVEASTATNVWVNTDGTFRNERVFSGTYRLVPQGPFLPADELKTDIPTGNIDFKVEPYLRIKLDEATLSGTSATVKFTVSRSAQWSQTMRQYIVVYSASDNFDINGYIKRTVVNTTDAILDVPQTVTIEGVDTAKPVFVRVAAQVNGASYWNYSVIERLK
jgi:hypothetical protein